MYYKKQNKYRNVKIEIDGQVFDSQKEYRVYKELTYRQMAGEISNLQRQVKFVLLPTQYYATDIKLKNGKPKMKAERAVEYIADFMYTDTATGLTIVSDCKSEITRKDTTYILKRKLMLYFHNIHIVEL